MGMGENIRKLRTEYGWTQEELGKKLGLQKSIIAKYENGRVQNIKRSTIAKMAELFNVAPSFLMGYSEESEGEDLMYIIDTYPLLKEMLFAGGKLMKTDPVYMESLVYTLKKMAEVESK